MKKSKALLGISLVAMSACALSGCNLFKKKGNNSEEQKSEYYAFSIGVESGASVIEVGSGKKERIVVYSNGVDSSGHDKFSYESTDESVATIDENGYITPIKKGKVNFIVTDLKSKKQKDLKRDLVIEPKADIASGGYNYSGGTKQSELEKRAEILGKLEKYAMDSHLTGITLFENGGYVKYSDRVRIPTTQEQYIEGYGFGIVTEGSLEGTLPGTDFGTRYPSYYHSAMAEDPLKINQFTATGSQVSDLASYITSTYWNTRLKESDRSKYEWYPCLASDEIYKPIFNDSGVQTGFASEKSANNEPVPAEAPNSAGLYRKWRIYVKTHGDVNGTNLKFTTASSELAAKGFNRGVTIDDYVFIYKLLLTGSNGIIRGTEMANDTSYGIKGAQRYFEETKSANTQEEINAKWNEYISDGKLGIKKDKDVNGDYLELELINPIDSFTAMYTLSSSLTSPLPEEMFLGSKAIFPTMKESANKYGQFNGEADNLILNYTLCLGAFTLTEWKITDGEIVFQRNNEWFETEPAGGKRYHIPGVYFRRVNSSDDTEKNWKQFEAGNLDSCGVPTSKVEENIGKEHVYETKGDSTFKLNVNSCTQDEWDALFGPSGKWPAGKDWKVKEWMSNADFLDGLFYSIDRETFAKKRGVAPSTNYFSNAYQMRNATSGSSYNATQAHKDAVDGFADDYGYDYDKAVDCFRNAVAQLASQNKITLGTKDKPTEISIHIRWMYQTDEKEYGNEIASYFTKAFNNDSVCGGKVKLRVDQEAVTSWEAVYNEWMMKGCFDLGFGAISGNTYNPLNFMEVLKSDNSSKFTLNWGNDTSKVDEQHPIIYDGKKWSFDALWEVADHGGIVKEGETIKPVDHCYYGEPVTLSSHGSINLHEGFDMELPVEFAEFSGDGSEGAGSGKVSFDVSRVDAYIFGKGNITLAENGVILAPDVEVEDKSTVEYDKEAGVIRLHVSAANAKYISDELMKFKGWDKNHDEDWQLTPFRMDKLDDLFNFELYYQMTIGEHGVSSINYAPVTTSNV